MELLIASLVEHELALGKFDPDGHDPHEVAWFQEWLEARELDGKVLAAAKAIGSSLWSPPVWALLTCFVAAERDKVGSSTSKSSLGKGYALDQLIFYLLEADERHWSDVEVYQSRQPPDEPQSDKPYEVAKQMSVDKAARWVCGTSDDEFDPHELTLRKALRGSHLRGSLTFDKRTLLRAWSQEQLDMAGDDSGPALVEGYKNTPRMTRVAAIWEAWRSSGSNTDPDESPVAPEYVGLFELLSRNQ